MTALTPHPGHNITVTAGPFGRAYFECSCGEQHTRASKADGVRTALAHHHRAGGCNCPDDIKALPEHPATPGDGGPRTVGAVLEARYWLTDKGAVLEARYWLTDKGWAAVGGRSS